MNFPWMPVLSENTRLVEQMSSIMASGYPIIALSSKDEELIKKFKALSRS